MLVQEAEHPTEVPRRLRGLSRVQQVSRRKRSRCRFLGVRSADRRFADGPVLDRREDPEHGRENDDPVDDDTRQKPPAQNEDAAQGEAPTEEPPELIQRFQAVLEHEGNRRDQHGDWSASHQQVYRDLAQLTEAGLVRFTEVSQEHRPDKKIYELTEAGREALRAWVDAPIKPPRIQDELLVKLLAGELVGSEALEKLLADQRKLHQEKLQTYRAIEREHFRESPLEAIPVVRRLVYMTLRRGILGEEAWLAWADELEAVIATLR
jgi:PadR family transcriptional regulator, regulatory protein AphA